jgi:hypothetical protein
VQQHSLALGTRTLLTTLPDEAGETVVPVTISELFNTFGKGEEVSPRASSRLRTRP